MLLLTEGREVAMASARKAIAALQQRGLRMAVNAWGEYAEERAELTRQLQYAVSGLRSGSIRKAFNSWESRAVELALMNRAVQALAQRQLSACFFAWANDAAASSERDRCLLSAASEWLGSRRRAAFGRWCDMVEEKQLLTSAALHFRSPSLLKGFNTWAEYAEARGEVLRAMAVALKSLAPEARLMRAAVNTWASVMLQRRSLMTAGAALMHASLRAGLSKWMELIPEAQRQRAVMRIAGPEEEGLVSEVTAATLH